MPVTKRTERLVEFFYFLRPLTMPRPKFPNAAEWTVRVPASLLLDKSIPDTAKVTWAQLRWMAWGGPETPPFTAQEFEEATGTKEKTLYGHLRILRDRHASRWHRGNGATFIVSFDCQVPESDAPPEFLEIENSRNPDDPILLANDQDHSEELKRVSVSGNREFSKSRKSGNGERPAKAGKPPPRQDGLFEAVAVVTKRAPPGNDWSKLPDVTRGILNKVTAQLRKVEATVQQVHGFPAWFERKKKDDYRLRRPLEPWDLPKNWPEYLDDGLRQHDGEAHRTDATGTGTSGIAARVAAIQRAADLRVRPEVPALRENAGPVPDGAPDGERDA